MPVRFPSVLSVALLSAGLLAGCSQSTTSKPPAPKIETTVKSEPAAIADPVKTEPVAAKAEAPPKELPKQVAAAESKAEPAKAVLARPAGGKKPKKVLLGSPELTAGLPGGGDLSIDEIEAWLDDASNHEELEIVLPLGLRAGAADVKGLKENPLTRAKIELGRQLYFDTRLSSDETVSCSSCHDPEQGFAAHTQFGVGIKKQEGGRNSPVSYNRILSDAQFWDGRANSLEAQAIGPIANPIEMGHTHDAAVAGLKTVKGYQLQFAKIFGDLTIENVGKAIASFERVIVTGPSPFDYNEQFRAYAKEDPEDIKDDPDYLAAKKGVDNHPMSDSAKRGRELFFGEKGSCTACHVGPNLADEKYHNLGVGMDAKKPDVGRFEFTKKDEDTGAFKTPTIRNVATSAPYMHDGTIKTLEEVVDLYDKGGTPNPHLDPKIKKLNLNSQEKADLVAFMKACTGDFPKVEAGRLPK